MSARVVYEYAIIRVVPKVEREEFLNVGVILFSKRAKYLDLRYELNESRLSCFSSELDLEQVREHLRGWEMVCRGGAEGGAIGQLKMAVRFRWLVANRSTIIQSSRVHPGLCTDPAAVLVDLYRRYVE